jgi:hypothetical protein
MSGSTFQLYTTMFTHGEQLCFHVQAAAWNEATGRTISQLTSAALETLDLTARTGEQQQELLLRLRDGLHDASVLNSHLESFRHSVNSLLHLTSVSAADTRLTGSMVWYTCAAALTWFASATKRTRSARFWALLGLAACLALETGTAQVVRVSHRDCTISSITTRIRGRGTIIAWCSDSDSAATRTGTLSLPMRASAFTNVLCRRLCWCVPCRCTLECRRSTHQTSSGSLVACFLDTRSSCSPSLFLVTVGTTRSA